MKKDLIDLAIDRIIRTFTSGSVAELGDAKSITMDFVKLNGRWFADVPGWEGPTDSLEMVCGADRMLDTLAEGKKIVTLRVTTDDPGSAEDGVIVATKTHQDAFGGTYDVSGVDHTIWLCNVTKFVFGDHPDTLYFKVVA